jgi:hypothetical protein
LISSYIGSLTDAETKKGQIALLKILLHGIFNANKGFFSPKEQAQLTACCFFKFSGKIGCRCATPSTKYKTIW